MARLPNIEVARREDFMKNLFRSNPEMSQAAATEQFMKKFNGKMRPQRVYALRKLVHSEMKKNGNANGHSAEMVMFRAPDANALSKPTLLEVAKGSERTVVEVLKLLKAKGLFNGEIAGEGPGFVVVTTA